MLRIALALVLLLGSTALTQAKPQAKPQENYRPWFYQEPLASEKTRWTIKAKKAVRIQKVKKATTEPRKAKRKPVAKKTQVTALPPPKVPVEIVQAPPKPETMAPDDPPTLPALPKVLQGSFDPFGNIIDGFKRFLKDTSQFIQGHTMTMQGMEKSLGWLEPKFRENLAKAIYQARQEGFTNIGVFSGYRQPNMGVGGFGNKYLSCHSYGLAVDMANIGGPGSRQAIRWHQIARENGIFCPYGPHNGAEWNHCQAVPNRVCGNYAGLRSTITGAGPKDPEKMWAAAKNLAKEIVRKTRVASRHSRKS